MVERQPRNGMEDRQGQVQVSKLEGRRLVGISRGPPFGFGLVFAGNIGFLFRIRCERTTRRREKV